MVYDASMRAFGPQAAAVESFLTCLNRLTSGDGHRLRRAFLDHAREKGLQGPAATERAAVTIRVIAAAVAANRREAHRDAMFAGVTAVGASAAQSAGVGVPLGDLAGAVAVRDVLSVEDFDYLARGWVDAMGEICLVG